MHGLQSPVLPDNLKVAVCASVFSIRCRKMWNKNFNLLLIANFFLYTAVYMLFPALHHWMVSEGGYTGFQAGGP